MADHAFHWDAGGGPDREVTTSLDGQGEWGGNLDVRDCCPGHRVLLPVLHDGALFYLGFAGCGWAPEAADDPGQAVCVDFNSTRG